MVKHEKRSGVVSHGHVGSKKFELGIQFPEEKKPKRAKKTVRQEPGKSFRKKARRRKNFPLSLPQLFSTGNMLQKRLLFLFFERINTYHRNTKNLIQLIW